MDFDYDMFMILNLRGLLLSLFFFVHRIGQVFLICLNSLNDGQQFKEHNSYDNVYYVIFTGRIIVPKQRSFVHDALSTTSNKGTLFQVFLEILKRSLQYIYKILKECLPCIGHLQNSNLIHIS